MKRILLIFSLISILPALATRGTVLLDNTELNVSCAGNQVVKINMQTPHDAKIACVPVGVNVGGSCGEDSECSSQCCSHGMNICLEHNPKQGIYCSKNPGQTCLADEFCRKEKIPMCFIVKTGRDLSGNLTCTRRCYYVSRHGECNQNNICTPPKSPPVPPFDPSNPDCSRAIDPSDIKVELN